METFKRAAGWVAAAAITVLAVVAAFYYRHVLHDRARAATARADAAERILAPQIDRNQKRLAQLAVQAAADSIAVKNARREVDDAKAKLADEFQSHGLTADEVVARFERLQLTPAGGRPPSSFGGDGG